MWYQRGCLSHVLGVDDRVLIPLGALYFKCTKVPHIVVPLMICMLQTYFQQIIFVCEDFTITLSINTIWNLILGLSFKVSDEYICLFFIKVAAPS